MSNTTEKKLEWPPEAQAWRVKGGKVAAANLLDRCRAVVDPDGTRTDKDREECAQQLKTAYYTAKARYRKVSEIGLEVLWAEECAK